MSRIFKTAKGTPLPLMELRGKEYLEIKYRIVWFREEHPDWRILTEIIAHDKESSLVCAKILDNAGNVMAMAHKTEDKRGFADHMEKCETSAIGRALALCGYGTQFCADELDEGARIVDAPTTPITKESIPIQYRSKPGINLADYVVDFGKFKGKTLASIDLDQLIDYVAYIEKTIKESSKPPQNNVNQFLANAKDLIQLVLKVEESSTKNGAQG